MEAWIWVQDNFTSVVNTAGIVGSLLFTAFAFRDNQLEREVSNLIALTEAHRDIWSHFQSDPEIARILDKDADVLNSPATKKEEAFVSSMILHLYCVHRSLKRRMYPRLEGIRRDIREFYSLPVPRQVWDRMSPFQDRDFLRFVEDALRT